MTGAVIQSDYPIRIKEKKENKNIIATGTRDEVAKFL